MKCMRASSILSALTVYVVFTGAPVWASDASLPVPFNTEPALARECRTIFGPTRAVVTETNGSAVFDSGRRAIIEHETLDEAKYTLDNEESPDVAVKSSISEMKQIEFDHAPDATLTPNGNLLVRETPTDVRMTRLVIKNSDGREIKSRLFDSQTLLGLRPVLVSPNEDFVVFNALSRYVVVSLDSGRKILERRAQNAAISTGNMLTLRYGRTVSVYALSPTSAQPVLSHDFDLSRQPDDGVKTVTKFDGALGPIQYVPRLKSYVAFFNRYMPMKYTLRPNGRLEKSMLRPSNLSFFDHGPLAHVTSPHYLERSTLVDETRSRAFAVREQGLTPHLKYDVDVFSLETGKQTASFNVPYAVGAMAVSPSGRYLAVSMKAAHGVLIFDLSKDNAGPLVSLDFDNADGGELAFADDHTVIAGSREHAAFTKFKF